MFDNSLLIGDEYKRHAPTPLTLSTFLEIVNKFLFRIIYDMFFLNFVFAGDEYEGKGIKIEREEMKVHMKNCKVPDDDVNTLFGEKTTSTGTDNGGAVTITEAILTDENESMPKPTSSEKTGTGDSSAASTEAVLTGNGNESEPQE